MALKYDLIGERFGKLIVVGRKKAPGTRGNDWECSCDCGNMKTTTSAALRNGKVKSCGCIGSGSQIQDITGKRFGRLLVTGFSHMAPNRVSVWDVRCDCGTEKKIRKSNLWVSKNGEKNTVSCGCHRKDTQRKRYATHGEHNFKERAKTKEYACWGNMKARCYNPNNKRYKDYGGRGITICDKWLNDFSAFLADVGRAPEDRPYIDRIDVNGNYEPGNVRWVDIEINNSNKR